MVFSRSIPVITVGLSPCWDITCYGQNLNWQEHPQLDSQQYLPAGKALNVSKALAWMGRKSIAAGLWGSSDYQEMLQKTSVLKRFVTFQLTPVPGSTRRNVTIIDTNRQQEIHLRAPNKLITAKALKKLSRQLVRIVKPDAFCVFSGSLAGDGNLPAIINLIKRCRDKGARVVVDTSGVALKAITKVEGLWLIKPNIKEFAELFPHLTAPDVSATLDALATLDIPDASGVSGSHGIVDTSAVPGVSGISGVSGTLDAFTAYGACGSSDSGAFVTPTSVNRRSRSRTPHAFATSNATRVARNAGSSRAVRASDKSSAHMIITNLPSGIRTIITQAITLLDCVENVLISLGKAGAILVNRHGVWQGSTPAADTKSAVTTVGCGDYMLAGFINSYISVSSRSGAKTKTKAKAKAKAQTKPSQYSNVNVGANGNAKAIVGNGANVGINNRVNTGSNSGIHNRSNNRRNTNADTRSRTAIRFQTNANVGLIADTTDVNNHPWGDNLAASLQSAAAHAWSLTQDTAWKRAKNNIETIVTKIW